MKNGEGVSEVVEMKEGYLWYKRPFYWVCSLFLLFLLLVPAACQYQAPLRGVAGYETYLATTPGYFGSPVKWVQDFLEVTPCQYRLLGWDEDDVFYYESVCDGMNQLWQFDPELRQSQRVATKPTDLYVQARSQDDVLEVVRAVGVRPREYESFTRPLYLVEDGLVSRDGLYTAVLTQRVYSVYDVVVFGEQ